MYDDEYYEDYADTTPENETPEEQPDENLIDKRATLQVLGGLMNEPSLIVNYGFEAGDFGDPFYEIIFDAINNLYSQGIADIDAFSIDTYCVDDPKKKRMFDSQQGVDYVNNAKTLSNPQNFKSYAGIVKKYACLRKLRERGLDIRAIYNPDVVEPGRHGEEIEKIKKHTVNSILEMVENKLVMDLRVKYDRSSKHDEFLSGDKMQEAKDDWKTTPDFGLPFHGQKILTTIVRGARLGTVSIYSGGTGTGKTRIGYGRMCGLAIPWYYNWEIDDFEYHEGLDNPSLIIQTELTRKENQSLILSYVSGVDEAIIRTGQYESKHQEDVVDKSIEYIKQSPLYLDIMTDFSVSDIEQTIRKYHSLYGCKYFFFDYLQMSPSIANEMAKQSGGLKSREDLVMLFAITRLKNLANELQIFLSTSTQLNNSYKDAGSFVDQSALRSAKSLADKIDVGDIMLTPSDAELKATKEFLRTGIVKQPNIVNHIYKCRGTRFSKLKLFQKADLGTCRVEDLFCTSTDNKLINVPVWDVEVDKQPSKKVKNQLDKFEKIIDENSENLEKMKAQKLYAAMNPEVKEEKEEEKPIEMDPELNTESHNALRDMGF